MSQLPVIVGMGGVNAAGRTSGHQAFRRTVLDALPTDVQARTLLGLAAMMRLVTRREDGSWEDTSGNRVEENAVSERYRQQILDHTLIRRIEKEHFDINGITANRQAQLNLDTPLVFQVRRRQLPETLPETWQIRELDRQQVEVTIPAGALDVLFPDRRMAQVRTAGQLPQGFEPNQLYRSVHHPRGLSMSVFAASDCLGQSGLDWETLRDRLDPDQIAVYAANSIGQLDDQGWGGLLRCFVSGNRATSKQMPLGYGQMPADFLNAYMLGSVGATGAVQGACATFLYNLRQGVDDIRSGRRRVVMVGTSDAPITPEVIEGFRAMGALADDDSLKALDALTLLTDADYQRACRPFARNCGFTIAEASQFVMLMDDRLALESGAQILGAIPDVFVNADGWKRSISAPGIGNYISLGKAVSLAKEIIGKEALHTRTFVHAHATSTPKNRVTESHVLDAVAKANAIDAWPVAGIKTFVGHSQGSAAGDQLASALGSFAHGLIPGLPHLDAVADDVYAKRLQLFRQPMAFDADAAFINAKGFGGNNATGIVLSPMVTERLLIKRHGQTAIDAWKQRRAKAIANSEAYQRRADEGRFDVIYRFGEGVLEGPELEISDQSIVIPGYEKAISLAVDNPFGKLDEK